MNLEQELHNYFELTSKDAQEFALTQMRHLIESGVGNSAIKKGDDFPDFELPDQLGESVSSAEMLARGPLVISFYRGAWCPYCNIELQALQAILPDIHELEAELVAISPNQPDQALTLQEKYDLDFKVLSDENNETARRFGLVFQLEQHLWERYKAAGIDLEAYNGNKKWELPIPATYIVDHSGVVLSYVDVDWTKRLEPSEIIKVLEGL